LPLFPGPALAYAEQIHKSQDQEAAYQAAESVWAKDWACQQSPDIALAFRGLDPIRETDFADWAERLFSPLVAHSTSQTAAKDLD
jgi:exonuclease V gamma subunit